MGETRDPGLQRERTRLAWRRTYLAVLVGALVALRLLPPVLGAAGLLAVAVVLVAAVLLTVLAERRGRRVQRQADQGAGALPRAGAVTLLLAGAVSFSSLVCAGVVVLARAAAR